MIVTPDVERLLPAILREALTSWSGLYVSRTKPERERPFVVTVCRSGGTSKQRVIDQVRIAVNVWAPDDVQANDLAEQVRAVIEDQEGRAPFKRIRASVPAGINAKAEPPQRFFYADVLVRRATA